MPTQTVPEAIDDSQLISIINTGQPGSAGLSKMRAIAGLRRSRSTQKVEIFSSILANRHEQPRLKRMAAMGLYEVGGYRAEQALIENSRNADEDIAPVIAQALGRIGSARSAPILRELLANAPRAARVRETFAVSLLAYRHNLDGNEIEVPSGDSLIELLPSSDSVEIRVTEPDMRKSNRALAALRREPIGVSLTTQNAHQFECGPNTFVLLWNGAFSLRRLGRSNMRKGVVGILYRQSWFDDDYSLSSVILGTPDGNGLQISAHNSGGKVLYAGMIDLSTAHGRFDIQACLRDGANPIELKGEISNGQMVLESARSAVTVHNPRIPSRAPDIV